MSEKQVKDYDKFVVRLPDGMRDLIAEMAKKDGRSMNSEIIALIELAIKVCRNFGPDDGTVVQQFQEQLNEINKKNKEIEEGISITKNEIDRMVNLITGNLIEKLTSEYDLVPKRLSKQESSKSNPSKK